MLAFLSFDSSFPTSLRYFTHIIKHDCPNTCARVSNSPLNDAFLFLPKVSLKKNVIMLGIKILHLWCEGVVQRGMTVPEVFESAYLAAAKSCAPHHTLHRRRPPSRVKQNTQKSICSSQASFKEARRTKLS